MNFLRAASVSILLILASGMAFAEDLAPIRQVSATGIKHSILITGSPDKAQLFDEDCKVVWEVEGYTRDGYVLDNGNILISDPDQAREFKVGTHDVIWSYKRSAENKELDTIYRLPNGNTLLVEMGVNPRLIEVAPDGKIAHELKLQPEMENAHLQARMARKMPNGNYLVPHLGAFKIKEYTPDGKVVREIPTDLPELGGREKDKENWPFTCILLDNGNILANLTHGNKTVEFDKAGKVAWRVDNTMVDGRFSDACGGQRLPNGNTCITAYAQRDAAKCKVFEVTRDKKVVWEFFHPTLHAHQIHVITTNGKKITPVLR